MVQLLVRQIVYTIVRSNSRPTFYLWWKENLVKQQKSQNILSMIEWKIFFCLLCFYSQQIWSRAIIVWLEFSLSFQKISKIKLQMVLIPNFDVTEKIGKSIYQAREVSPFFATWLLSIYVKTVSKTVELTKLLKKLSLYQSGTSYNQ